jgi:hypothetical protein
MLASVFSEYVSFVSNDLFEHYFLLEIFIFKILDSAIPNGADVMDKHLEYVNK